MTGLSNDEVWLVYQRSIQTLLALPDRDRARGFGRAWPDYVRDYIDAYDPEVVTPERFQPTARDISHYLDVLAWGRGLDRLGRQLLLWRAMGASYRRIADLLEVSHETVRHRCNDAIDQVRLAAHAASSQARADSPAVRGRLRRGPA